MGNNNTIEGASAADGGVKGMFVFGNNVTADVDNSVYLGNKSRATAGSAVNTKVKNAEGAEGATTTAGDKGTVSEATINKITYGGFAGATADGVVTVGAAGAERRIQNLAAGEISKTSTDAINGSQLWNIFDQGGITFSNGTNATAGDKANKSKLVKFGDTVKIDGVGDIKVDFDADNKTYKISGPTTQPQVTVPTYTVGADKTNAAEGITLNGQDGNNRVDIIGKDSGAIETSVSGRNVVIDLNKTTKDEIAKIAKGTKYAGDYLNTTEADKTNEFTRPLGEVTNIKGGKTSKDDLTDGNIGVESDGTSTLTVKLAKALTGLESAVFTKDGNTTTINSDGVTINDGPKIVKGGIDAGNHGITNVKSGIPDGKKLSEVEGDALNNAANVGDLQKAAKAAKTEVVGEKQAIVSGKEQSDGHMKYTVSATKTTVEGSGDVKVTGGVDSGNGLLAYTADLTADAKEKLAKADSALQSWIAQANGNKVKEVKKDDNILNFVNGENIEITNDNGKVKVSTSKTLTFDSGTVKNEGDHNYITKGNTNIVNGGDVYNAIHSTNSQYQGDNTDVTVKRNPDQILGVKGGAEQSKLTDGNIGTVGDAGGSITVKLAKNLTNLSSVAIENGPTISSTGIDMGDKPITNLTMNTEPGDKDGVNVKYLKDYVTKQTNGGMTEFTVGADKDAKATGVVVNKTDNRFDVVGGSDNIKTSVDGRKITVDLNKNLDLTKDGSVKIGDNTNINKDGVTTPKVSISGDKKTTIENGKVTGLEARDPVTNVADYGKDGNETRAATEGAVKKVNDKVSTNTNDITKLKEGWNLQVNSDEKTKGSVTAGETVDLKAEENSLVITKAAESDIVTFGLANTIKVGETNPVTINGDAGTVNGLTNKAWDPDSIVSGQAATED